MPNGHPVSSTMYNRGDLHGVVYSNDIEFDDVLLSNVITTSTVIANLNVSTTVSSNILSSGLLLGSVTVSKLLNSAISTSSNITADTKLAYNLLSSLITSSSVVGNITIPKLVNTSLVSTGTIVADLTVGSSSSVDADAAAFFARVTAAGGTLTTTEQNAVNTLVVQMKADGIWTKMKAIYPMVGASAAACAQNLKSASFTGTFSSGWTFASTGVTPNGTSAFMNTGLVPSANIASQNSNHISFYSRSSQAASIQVEMGSLSTLLYFHTHLRYTGDIYYMLLAAGTLGTVSNNTSLGFFNGSRINSTNVNHLRNGVSLGNPAITSVSLNSFPVYIGALNSSGTTTNFSSKQCAFATIGDGLTDSEAANFYTAVQAFQTSLNRQVN